MSSVTTECRYLSIFLSILSTSIYCCCSGDLVPLDGAGDCDEDADGEGEVAGALQHLVHRPGVHHLHTNMGKNIAALTDEMVIVSLS